MCSSDLHALRLELKLQNAGKTAADKLVATLPLPAALVDIQTVTPGASVNGQTVTFAPSTPLAPGGSIVLVVKAKVAAGVQDGQTLALSAQVVANAMAAPATVAGPTLTVVQKPILTVKKTFEDPSGGDRKSTRLNSSH